MKNFNIDIPLMSILFTMTISCIVFIFAPIPNKSPSEILARDLLYGKSEYGQCFHWVRDNMRKSLTEINCEIMEGHANDKK